MSYIIAWLGEFLGEKILDKLTDYGFGELISKKIIITPREIEFINSDWTSKNTIIISNISNQSLFSIYIIGRIEGGKLDDLDIEVPRNIKGFDLEFGEFKLNHSIMRLNGKDKDGTNAFMIKISSIRGGTDMKFIAKSKHDLKLNLKALSYKKIPERVLEKPNSVSVPIQLPVIFSISSISLLLSKK